MSPSAANELVAALRRTCDSADASDVAINLVITARTIAESGDEVAKVFLARTMIKVARQLDPQVSFDTQ